MTRYLDQLKPQERRWVVGIGFVLFVMLNYFFVWPHFHDWSRDNLRMESAQKQIGTYQAELRHKDEYARKLRELQSDGSSVLPEDQAIDFVHFYNSRAVSNRVVVTSQGQLVTSTNEFFLEQRMNITVQAYETNLVKFLYSLGAGNSMMRVRAMSLHPDPSHQEISANITIVASYQKKGLARPAGSAPANVASAKVQPAPPIVRPPPVTHAPPPTDRPVEHTNHVAGPFARPVGTNKPFQRKF